MSHVLLYLDLDQFKVVNDTCGHQAGDRLLKQLTSVVQTRIRTTDTLARLGGDEFGVLLQDCTLETAQRIAENLRQAIRDFRFVWQDGDERRRVHRLAEITAHSEIAGGRHERRGRRLLLGKGLRPKPRADLSTGASSGAASRMQWVSRINRACEEDRLLLVCQPIVPIRAGVEKLRHFELLLRMKDENGRWYSPAEFIPAAERYNLMPALDRWVVRRACTQHVHRRGDDRASAIHAGDQRLRHDAQRRAVSRFRARGDGSSGREPRRAVLRDDRDGRHEQPRRPTHLHSASCASAAAGSRSTTSAAGSRPSCS